jgi:CHC2 zinc finger
LHTKSFDILQTWQRLTGEVPKKVSAHEYAVLCPAHEDQHPSLHLNDQKQLALCRSCGWKGNAITLAVALGIARDTREARMALERFGISIR